MRQPAEFNPYSPTRLDTATDSAVRPPITRVRRIGSLEVCIWSIGVCTLAGCLFGMLTFLLFLLGSFLTEGGNDDLGVGIVAGTLILSLYGIVVGGFVAFVASLPTVLVAFIVSVAARGTDQSWDRVSIGRFAAICGLFAGFLPITLASQFDPMGILSSLIPAGFGCLIARLLIIPLARKAADRAEPLSKQPVGNYADP